jgi:hypothetical protein
MQRKQLTLAGLLLFGAIIAIFLLVAPRTELRFVGAVGVVASGCYTTAALALVLTDSSRRSMSRGERRWVVALASLLLFVAMIVDPDAFVGPLS